MTTVKFNPPGNGYNIKLILLFKTFARCIHFIHNKILIEYILYSRILKSFHLKIYLRQPIF